MIKNIESALQEHLDTITNSIKKHNDDIEKTVKLLVQTLQSGNKLLVCGNGGSAADSYHICGEFLNRLLKERQPLPAIALCGDTSTITAISNDYSYEQIYSKQVEALGRPGDVLWVLTTSGGSANLIKAAEVAKQKGLKVLAFSGKNGGDIAELSDICFVPGPSKCTTRIQEVHEFLYHIIIELVEDALTSK